MLLCSGVAEAVPGKIPYAAYLAAEVHRETKHEYLDGVERAMAGGTPDHGALAAQLIGQLVGALAERPCRVFSSDVRVRIERANRSVYPDASVVCGKLQNASDDANAIVNPVLIVEVISDSSEAYDRGEKFRYYKLLASLVEYVLVSQREPLVEVFRRDGESWRVTEYPAGTVVRLDSVGAAVSVDALYRNPLTA
jgi:Uma2 family endonuclease